MTKYNRLADRQIRYTAKVFMLGVLVGAALVAVWIPAIINNLTLNDVLRVDACARGLDNCKESK